MNRREFLRPQSLADIAGPVLSVTEELDAEPSAPSDPVLLRFSRRAMATKFELIVPMGTPGASEFAQAALDEIDRLEAQLTVYHDSSEVSRLNRMAYDHPVRVEKNLFELLTVAKRIHAETDGAFDIAIGALIKTWGFFRRQGRVPTLAELAGVRERIGMQHLILDADRQTVRFTRQGLAINLGSIGKGYALDLACRAGSVSDRRSEAVGNLLLHGGHSSIFAWGNESPVSHGWTIGLTDPLQPQCRRALVHLCNRAMATSAITFQHFEHLGKKLGHLLDPRTCWPAEGILSATATAPTAAEADALATAFFILGIEKSCAYCEKHPEIGAALISADAPGRVVVIGKSREEIEVIR